MGDKKKRMNNFFLSRELAHSTFKATLGHNKSHKFAFMAAAVVRNFLPLALIFRNSFIQMRDI
jgi:hypothetical protein